MVTNASRPMTDETTKNKSMTNEELPLVSAIIPSYNYERTIGLCIDALIAQTYPKLEIIVVDDQSTDGSVAEAKKRGVTVVVNETNGGVAVARNRGVVESSGDVLFFVDADVVVEAEAIERAVAQLSTDDGIASVCGIYEPEPLIRDSLWEEFRSLQAYVWRVASIGDVSAGFFSLGAIRRSAFEVAGPFQTNLRQTEEIDYGERLTRVGRIMLSDQVRGRHDDDSQLWPMMRKLGRRSRDRVPFYLRRRQPMQGFELPRRLLATALAGVGWASLAASILWTPAALLSATAAIGAVTLESDVYRAALKYLGPIKLVPFVAWYVMFHTAAGVGVLTGIAGVLVDRDFRRMYGDWDGRAASS